MAEKTAAVERTLTVNIRRDIIKVPRYKRAKKAVTVVRKFLQRHMKAPAENVKLGKYLNLKLWERGMRNPVHKITFIAKKDEKGIVTAELPNIPVKKQKEQKHDLLKKKVNQETAEEKQAKGKEGKEKKEAKPEAQKAQEAKKAEVVAEPEKVSQPAAKAEAPAAATAKKSTPKGK